MQFPQFRNGRPSGSYYYKSWSNENDYFENVTYPVTSIRWRLTYPGRYRLTVNYVKRTYDYNSGYDYWSSEYNDYEKYRTINVKGKVIFNDSKGKLRKKSAKTKYVNQRGKVGTLPKVKAPRGYKFKGWYTKKRGGKKIKKSTKVVFTKASKTYYAQFKKK